MANRKISALSALLSGDVSVANDYLPIIDASELDADKNKRITVEALGQAILAGLTNLTVTGSTTLGDSGDDLHTITGGVRINTSASLPASTAILLANANAIQARNAADSAYIALANVTAANLVEIAKTGFNIQIGDTGGTTTLGSTAVVVSGTLAVNGNTTLGDATTDSHTINGSITQTVGAAYTYRLARSGGGDVLRLRSEPAGGGSIINVVNAAETDLEPLNIGGEYVSIDARVSAGSTAEIARINSTGLGVFCTPAYPLEVRKSNNGSEVAVFIQNESNTASSNARIYLQNGGTSGGDPTISFYNGSVMWTAGLDESDGDAFKISKNSTLGGNDFLTVTASGIVKIGDGISSASPLHLVGAGSTGNNYLSFYRGDFTTRKAYVGFGSGASDVFQIFNEESGSGIQYITTGTNSHVFYTNANTPQLEIAHTASAVNYWSFTGNATGSPIVVQAAGSDSNIGMVFRGKGSSSLSFQTDSGNSRALEVAHAASAVNYVTIQGGATGNGATVAAGGSDTNVPLYINTQGTGEIRLRTNAGAQEQFRIAHTASAVNYVQVTGSATGNFLGITAQGSDSNIGMAIASKGAGTIDLYGNATLQVQIGNQASAVNYIRIQGGSTGNSPRINAQGSDTNVGLDVSSQGTGSLNFYTNNLATRQVQIAHTASAVNYLFLTGAATGGVPSVSAVGSDTNIDLLLQGQGTGHVRFGTHTGSGDVAISGYITIKDSAGNTRKLAVIT